MKSKELIRQLQELDRTGETEVVIGNQDIRFVELQPGYYDGCAKLLIRDSSITEHCDVVGIKIASDLDKIQIHTMSIRDYLHDYPDGKVEYDSEYSKLHNEQRIEECRSEIKAIITKVNSKCEGV